MLETEQESKIKLQDSYSTAELIDVADTRTHHQNLRFPIVKHESICNDNFRKLKVAAYI